jgi:Tol biopolymer transport system component
MMRKILVAIIVMLFCFMPLTGCAHNNMDKGKPDIIREISFSPDGKKILFDRGNGGRPLMIHVYDMETGELIAYRSPLGEQWGFARYSFDGKHIVFIAIPLIGNKEDIANAQIAVMDPDGKNVRKITKTTGLKLYPSFSHSGRKIIFTRADVIRESGHTPAADYDVYEVDVATGRETRLTQFRFFKMTRPYYFPDDKTFVFWGEHPFAYPAVPNSDRNSAIMDKVRKELQAKYQDNSIYVMQANEKELKPYLVMPDYRNDYSKEFKKHHVVESEYSRGPSLSADGSVLVFMSTGYKPDGSADWEQLYQYSADGNHRRITYLHAVPIWAAAVSPNGELLAVIHNIASSRDINNIVLYQVKDGTSKEIALPDQPSRIINSQ